MGDGRCVDGEGCTWLLRAQIIVRTKIFKSKEDTQRQHMNPTTLHW